MNVYEIFHPMETSGRFKFRNHGPYNHPREMFPVTSYSTIQFIMNISTSSPSSQHRWKGTNVWNALEEVIPNVVENSNLSIDKVAECFKVSSSFVTRVMKRYRQRSNDSTNFFMRTKRGRSSKLTQQLKSWIASKATDLVITTQQQLANLWKDAPENVDGITLCQSTVSRILKELNVTRKRVEVSAVQKDSLPLRHLAFNNVISKVPHHQLAALDETSFILNDGLMYPK